MAWTLETMGHIVHRLQENGTTWDIIRMVADKSDMLLWVTTQGQDQAGAAATIKHLRQTGTPTVSYHLDLFWGVNRQAKIFEEPFFRTDHLFTADGGHDPEWETEGINHHWAPPAIYKPNAVTGTVDQKWPIIFVGSSPYPHPEHAHARQEMLDWIRMRYGSKFRLIRGGCRGQDLADMIAGTSIVLGDSCLAGKIPRYWSDRIPETIGRAGFLIHPYIPGIETEYTDGKHLRTFTAGNPGELYALIDHYLANPDEADIIKTRGQAHVLKYHTYENRMADMLDVVFNQEHTEPGEIAGETIARPGRKS